MKTITSFKKNHDLLMPGFYLSDEKNGIYTYDLRFKKPNGGDYIGIAAAHSIEHLLATALRNSEYADNIVYFGPMGCRTGFYLLLKDIEPKLAEKITADAITAALKENSVPGSKKIQCGNFRSHNLKQAKNELQIYLNLLRY